MSKEHCCCGCIHVKVNLLFNRKKLLQTGALIIGSLVLIFGIIGLLASVVTGNVQGIVSSALSVIIGGCIIYADKSHKPGGYLPYLIFAVKLTFYYVDKDFFQAIGIVIYTFFIICFVIMAIAAPGTLSVYTQGYGYGTQHKDGEIDSTTGIFWHILLKNQIVRSAHVRLMQVVEPIMNTTIPYAWLSAQL